MKQKITIRQALDEVVSKMSAVMSREEIVSAVLERFHSKAKKPATSIMEQVRCHPDLVALGDGHYARADYVLEGAKFRIKPGNDEIAAGIVNRSWFHPFDKVMPTHASIFALKDGRDIPMTTRVVGVEELTDEQLKSMLVNLAERFLGGVDTDALAALNIFQDDDPDTDELALAELFSLEADDEEFADEMDGELAEKELLDQARQLIKAQGGQEIKGHNFEPFFKENKVKEGDSLIVTISPKTNTYIFEYEPASETQRLIIRHHDHEISEFIHQAIKRDMRVEARDLIFQAYGKFVWLKQYPSNHWREIVENDDQLRLITIFGDYIEIASIDFHMMLDSLGMDEVTRKKQHKRSKIIQEEIDSFCDRFEEASSAACADLTTVIDAGGLANVIRPDRRLCAPDVLQEESETDTGGDGNGHFGPLRVVKDSEAVPIMVYDECDYQAISEHDEKLIEQFFAGMGKKRTATAQAEKKAGDVALFADFLASYQDRALEYADYDCLEEFFFMWYPRKVLNSSPAHIRQMFTNLREFYQFLVKANYIRSAKFAEAIFNLRELAAEKVKLYDRLPYGNDYHPLFEKLFGLDW